MPLMSTKVYDVAVIGAGVFGAWTAYSLQRRGRRVVLIDAHGPGNSRSSSGDQSRIIRMGYGADEVYTDSAIRSQRLWNELFEAGGEPLFVPAGVLWLAHDGDPYPRQTLETLKRFGVPCEELTPADVSARYPQFNLEGIAWALFEPESGIILARRAVQLVVRQAISCGVEYLHDAVGQPDETKNLESVSTAAGRQITAEHFVFACGPWLPTLFPRLLANRIWPTRQEVFYFGAQAGDLQFHSPAMPVWIDFKNEVYGMPDVEDRGIKCAVDRHGELFDPEDGDRVATSQGLDAVRQRLALRLPALRDAPVLESRVCQYENTSNGDFLIDRHPDFENVWLVGGGSGHGFKHGPVVGEYVTAGIAGRREKIEPRFSLASKGTAQQRVVY